MLPLNMQYNMEFIQAFNPLYAVPIVAVILCAFIVYAFGFKSPVPPPSFDGFEEEKKLPKKRKPKETQKVNKLIQNGKVSVNLASKETVKRKEIPEKSSPVQQPVNLEKTTKKSKSPKENKVQEKEDVQQDEINEDGWVQLVSKKGKKNKKDKQDGRDKKEDKQDVQSDAAVQIKVSDVNVSDESSQIEESESPKKVVDPPVDVSLQNQVAEKVEVPMMKEKPKEIAKKTITPDKVEVKANVKDKSLPLVKDKAQDIEVLKQIDDAKIKDVPNTEIIEVTKPSKESSKSKKKKKKSSEISHSENEEVDATTTSTIPDLLVPPISENSDIIQISVGSSASQLTEENDDKLKVEKPPDVKSNIAFDELAGLYPEPKEQKKKKKVRRDH